MKKDIKRLVLFDFDGTLTRSDSLFTFLRFYQGNFYFGIKFLQSLPALLGYLFGFINNSKAKEILLFNFLGGDDESKFKNRCKFFARKKIPSLLNEKVYKEFLNHISDGDRVVIVSASIEDWIVPWADQWNVEVLATKLASNRGILSGSFEGKNCNGEEKVTRIKSHIELSNYHEIWAYGDSKGDRPMFSLASKVVYRGTWRE